MSDGLESGDWGAPMPAAAWAAALFSACRVAGLLSSLFWVRGVQVPWLSRLGLIAVLSLSLAFTLGTTGSAPDGKRDLESVCAHPATACLVAASELLVGAALGWGVLMVFAAVLASTRLVFEQIGLRLGAVFDPSSSVGGDAAPDFLQAFAWVLFFALEIHHALLGSLSASFAACPPGTASPGRLLALVGGAAVDLGPDLAAAALALSLPVMLLMLVASGIQGLLARSLPHGEQLFLSTPVRAALGIAAAAISLPLVAGVLKGLFGEAIEGAQDLARVLSRN
jgi:flagellar biosynthetic protein FliR